MKIISKYQDYYDSALAYGSDDSIIYIRNEEHIKAPLEKEYSYGTKIPPGYPKEFNTLLDLYSRLPSNYFKLKKESEYKSILQRTELVGFCGKIYPIFHVEFECKSNTDCSNKEYYFYDIDTMEEYLKQYLEKDAFYKPESKWDNFFNITRKYQFTEKGIIKLLDEIDTINKSTNRFDTFFSINSPVFTISYSRKLRDHALIKNPILKDYNFFRLKDPYVAFGEISQFISGVLSSNKKLPVEFTDKEKLQSHGFDNWSFKKEPGTKKRKKRK